MHESPAEGLLQEFEPIFYPKSIAIVDASQNMAKVGSYWLKTIVEAGFSGNIYPVNSCGGELLGLKIYRSIKEIPEAVDYVIISLSGEDVSCLLDDCATKKVKAVQFFAASFIEAGDTMRHKLEKELVYKARQGGLCIIGPNCIGVYCPESKMPYGPGGKLGEVGSVGFISQSRFIGEKLVQLGAVRSINYSKGIDFGDGIDLESADFMEYLAVDPKTSIIGAYIESSRDSRRLLNTIRQIARTKPLIIWKGGRPKATTSAISQAGFLADSSAVWSAALRQAGAIEVHNLEELTDTLLIFQQLHQWQGNGIAIIGGLADGGGGISVSAGDACAELGLNIPPLSEKTGQKLLGLLGQVGSIFRNPVDIGQAGGNPFLIQEAIELVLADSRIDLVLVQEDMGVLLKYLPWEQIESINAILADFRAKQDKPIIVVLPPGAVETERIEMERRLLKASIPVFPSMPQAAKAIVNLSRYSRNVKDFV
jgi:acyl-CoA synthetase (NDP forming)